MSTRTSRIRIGSLITAECDDRILISGYDMKILGVMAKRDKQLEKES